MSWEIRKFGEIVQKIVGGGTPSKSNENYWNGSIYWASVKDMEEGKFKLSQTQDTISEEGLYNSSSNLIPLGTLIISTRMGLGRAFINSVPMAINQDLKAIYPNTSIVDNNFLLWSYISKAALIENMGNGATVKGIRLEQLKSIEINLPPLQTQKRIADILSAYDDLIENNLKRIKLLEQAAQNIYKEWFVNMRFPGHENAVINEETGLHEGWKEEMLKDSCYLTMGQSPKSEYYNSNNDGLPFHQGVTGYGNRFVTHSTYCTKETRLAEEGDILCSVRAPVGRLNISPSKLIIGRGLSAIRNKKGFQSFQYYQLKSHFHKEDMIGGGAIFNSVTKKVLEEQKLLSPSNDVILNFEGIVNSVDKQIGVLDIQNQKLKAARDILLPRLMNRTIEVE